MVSIKVVQTEIGEEVVISGSILNQAKHRQPFPEMTIQLSDDDGVIIDQFKITKKHYLTRSKLRKKRYVEPDQKIPFRFKRQIKTASPNIKVEFN